MKLQTCLIGLVFLVAGSAYSDSVDFVDFKTASVNIFNQFCNDVSHGNSQILDGRPVGSNNKDKTFGLSTSFSLTSYPLAESERLASLFLNGDSSQGSTINLATYSLGLRFASMKLPLDFGVSVGYIPAGFPLTNKKFKYEDIGIATDLRYFLVEDPNFLNLSVGSGFGYSGSTLTRTMPSDVSMSIPGYSKGGLRLNPDNFKSENSRFSAGINAQISKNADIFTPFLGFSSYATFGTTSFSFNGDLYNLHSSSPSTADMKELSALTGMDFAESRISLTNSDILYSFNVHGGAALNFSLVTIDYLFLYQIGSRSVVNSLSFRFDV